MRLVRIGFAALVVGSGLLTAADWPQWGGPSRSFELPPEAQPPAWPASGPTQLWSRELGDGYSAVVTAGDIAYTMYRKGTQDVVIALDAATGRTIWETGIDAPHRSSMNVEAGPGPHSTPAIAGDRIFVTTVVGTLAALDRKTGKRLWSKNLWDELKGTFLERGYASSPLIYRESIVLPVGGTRRALMAFKQSDGSTLWSGGDADNSYSSPIAIRVAGRDQIVSFMAREVIAIDPGTAKMLWAVPHRTMYDINAATPVWCESESTLVVSSGYDGGARGIQVTGAKATELWNHKRLRVHHGNMACAKGVVYGASGDFGPAPLTAVDARTGRVLWQDRTFTKANFVLAKDVLLATDDDGSVGAAQVSREGFKLLGQAEMLRANSWTCPTLSGSRLFVRDRHRLTALDLNAPARKAASLR